VVIGKKKTGTHTAGASKAPKEIPIINLSDDKEVYPCFEIVSLFFLFIYILTFAFE
jgi:hypothetical protein